MFIIISFLYAIFLGNIDSLNYAVKTEYSVYRNTALKKILGIN